MGNKELEVGKGATSAANALLLDKLDVLQRENAELKAYVEELRGFIDDMSFRPDDLPNEMDAILNKTPTQSLADHNRKVAEKAREACLKEITKIIQSIQVRVMSDGALDDEDSIRESAVFDVEDAIRNMAIDEVLK